MDGWPVSSNSDHQRRCPSGRDQNHLSTATAGAYTLQSRMALVKTMQSHTTRRQNFTCVFLLMYLTRLVFRRQCQAWEVYLQEPLVAQRFSWSSRCTQHGRAHPLQASVNMSSSIIHREAPLRPSVTSPNTPLPTPLVYPSRETCCLSPGTWQRPCCYTNPFELEHIPVRHLSYKV